MGLDTKKEKDLNQHIRSTAVVTLDDAHIGQNMAVSKKLLRGNYFLKNVTVSAAGKTIYQWQLLRNPNINPYVITVFIGYRCTSMNFPSFLYIYIYIHTILRGP
jgi:hypothetical protein